MTYPRERWFRVINPTMKTCGLQGPCRAEQKVSPWWHSGYDLLKIEFGRGCRWIRRDNLIWVDYQ